MYAGWPTLSPGVGEGWDTKGRHCCYDAASNRVTMTDSQNGVTGYVYDTLNRLASLTDPQSNQFTFGSNWMVT